MPKHLSRVLIFICIIGMTLAAVARSNPPATEPTEPLDEKPYLDILQKPIVLNERFFDKRWPPKGLVLDEKFCAHTDTYFSLQSYVYGPDVEHGVTDKGAHYVDIRITGFRITLGLDVTVSFTQDATPATMRHEDGHRRIGDRIYDHADLIADQLARPMIGTIVRGYGSTDRAAELAAYGEAGSRLVRAYHARVDPMADRVHEIFDRITDHANNYEPHESEALRQAFDEFDREGGWTQAWADAEAARAATRPAATQPSTRPATEP